VQRTPGARLATADFSLEDSDGKRIRLSHLRGKTALLCFWSPGAPASLDDVPALKNLQGRYPDPLAVLGVCIPAAPSCAGEHEHGHDHTCHYHDESGGGTAGKEHMVCLVRDAATRLRINYPMIADTKRALGRRFSVEDLPAYVLIDADGMVRRCFVGFRTESALAAMVEEVADRALSPELLPAGDNRVRMRKKG
jgi:peroxiredoxin